MEISRLKKWIQPAILALPRKRWMIISVTILIVGISIASPLFNRWMYPLKYSDYILNSAKATQADPYLVMAIIRVETKFDPEGTSKVGASGLMQLMPQTVDYAIKKGNFSSAFRDYTKDPAINIHMGSWYIAELTKRFSGNKVAVMAAYNAGPTKVQEWLSEKVWDGTRQNVDQIPYGQTRHYIQRVTFFYEKYKQIYSDMVNKNSSKK